MKRNAADAFKNASYVSLRREPKKKKNTPGQSTTAAGIIAFFYEVLGLYYRNFQKTGRV